MTRYDLVLYGASGFTGQYAIENFVNSPEYGQVSFAVAGRSEAKLRKSLELVGEWTGKNLSHIPIIIADSSNEAQLAQMAKQAKVVLSAVGPYVFYGEPVVKAAIENGAHYVDITGETPWIEEMQAKYGKLARERGVFILNNCGFDSVPPDLGMVFLRRQFAPGTLAYAEMITHSKPSKKGYPVNTGTYETLINHMGLKPTVDPEKIRCQIMPTKLPYTSWPPPKRSLIEWNDALQAYTIKWLPYDKLAIERTQYFEYQRDNSYKPATIQPRWAVKGGRVSGYLVAVLMLFFGAVMYLAAQFGPTRRFLLKNPELCTLGYFTSKGPSREQAKETRFTMWFIGTGWAQGQLNDHEPTQRLAIRCDGPDPGYGATTGAALACAFCLLKDAENLPGVMTPAAALGNTKIFERLAQFDITFRVDNSILDG